MTIGRAAAWRGIAATVLVALAVGLLLPHGQAVAAGPGGVNGVAARRACGAPLRNQAACDILVVDAGVAAASPNAATAAPTRATTTTTRAATTSTTRATTTSTTRATTTTVAPTTTTVAPTTTTVAPTTTTVAPTTTTTVAPTTTTVAPTTTTTVAPSTTTTIAPTTTTTRVTTTTVAPTTTIPGPGIGGFTPAQVKSAYGWPTSVTAGTDRTIVIVTAFHAPTLEADLATFNAQFGLPACTVRGGCLSVYDQTGGTRYPTTNAAWALETTMDVQWAHAIAPGAKIFVVEATDSSTTNLVAAAKWGRDKGGYVSMSWGVPEFSGETDSAYSGVFVRSGVSFFASAGNSGGTAQFPSASKNVVSVGGTNLVVNGNTVTETGWTNGGGGCSAYESAPSAQSGFSGYSAVKCGGKRATPDVSAVADPATGVWVYSSTPYDNRSGWFLLGGTSAATVMVAARAAATGTALNATAVYGTKLGLRDVTAGGNALGCKTGYDLCSGRGTWTGSTP